jgi:hypothetical protein
LLDAAGAGRPRELNIDSFAAYGGTAMSLPLQGFNAQMAALFRPPTGDQILYLGASGGRPALFVVDADGTDARALVDLSTPGIGGHELGSPVWSPDGSKIAFTIRVDPAIGDYRVFVMNADGSHLRQLRKGTLASIGCISPCAIVDEGNPAWSPDGSQIAIQRWFNSATYELLSSGPITIVDVETGAQTEIDNESVNGYLGWGWSPDGKSILLLPNEDQTPGGGLDVPDICEVCGRRPTPGTLLIADASSGAVRQVDWNAGSAVSWQRVAAP